MYVLCGNDIEDLEQGLIAMRQAVAAGAPMGVGGSTMEEVEQGMECLRNLIPKEEEIAEDVNRLLVRLATC